MRSYSVISVLGCEMILRGDFVLYWFLPKTTTHGRKNKQSSARKRAGSMMQWIITIIDLFWNQFEIGFQPLPFKGDSTLSFTAWCGR